MLREFLLCHISATTIATIAATTIHMIGSDFCLKCACLSGTTARVAATRLLGVSALRPPDGAQTAERRLKDQQDPVLHCITILFSVLDRHKLFVH